MRERKNAQLRHSLSAIACAARREPRDVVEGDIPDGFGDERRCAPKWTRYATGWPARSRNSVSLLGLLRPSSSRPTSDRPSALVRSSSLPVRVQMRADGRLPATAKQPRITLAAGAFTNAKHADDSAVGTLIKGAEGGRPSVSARKSQGGANATAPRCRRAPPHEEGAAGAPGPDSPPGGGSAVIVRPPPISRRRLIFSSSSASSPAASRRQNAS